MKKYAEAWDERIKKILEDGEVETLDLEEHLLKIQWLQHERLVHLMVMLFVGLLLMTVFVLLRFRYSLLLMVLFLILLILTLFYCLHYYFLENTVQRWYVLADQISEILGSRDKTDKLQEISK